MEDKIAIALAHLSNRPSALRPIEFALAHLSDTLWTIAFALAHLSDLGNTKVVFAFAHLLEASTALRWHREVEDPEEDPEIERGDRLHRRSPLRLRHARACVPNDTRGEQGVPNEKIDTSSQEKTDVEL